MKKILLPTTLGILAMLGMVFFAPVTAAQDIAKNICESAGGTFIDGTCINQNDPNDPGLFGQGGLVRNVVNILLFVVGVIAVIMLIIGAIRYVTSGGDPNGTKGAKDTILYAIIGLVVAFAAFAIIDFVITGLNNDEAGAGQSSFTNVTDLV